MDIVYLKHTFPKDIRPIDSMQSSIPLFSGIALFGVLTSATARAYVRPGDGSCFCAFATVLAYVGGGTGGSLLH